MSTVMSAKASSAADANGFPNIIRTRPWVLDLADPDAPGTFTIRIQSADVWDTVRMRCNADTSLRAVKLAAMKELLPDVRHETDYMVKLGGGEIRNEAVTLGELRVGDSSLMFLDARRRHPVR